MHLPQFKTHSYQSRVDKAGCLTLERGKKSESVLTGLNRLQRDKHLSQRSVLGRWGRSQRAGLPGPTRRGLGTWWHFLGDTFLWNVIQRSRRRLWGEEVQQVPFCRRALSTASWQCATGGFHLLQTAILPCNLAGNWGITDS